MLKPIHLALFLQLTAPIFAQTPPGNASKGSKQIESTMPAARVSETLEDARVKSFIKMAENVYDGVCVRPSSAVKSKVRANGSGDFSSTFYEFQIPCSSKKKDGLGLTAIDVNAEFSPPRPGPLNLILSVHLKE